MFEQHKHDGFIWEYAHYKRSLKTSLASIKNKGGGPVSEARSVFMENWAANQHYFFSAHKRNKGEAEQSVTRVYLHMGDWNLIEFLIVVSLFDPYSPDESCSSLLNYSRYLAGN